jgi:hypothetical protein
MLQTDSGEGPCLDVIIKHQVLITGRLPEELRCPHCPHRANAETGIEGILMVLATHGPGYISRGAEREESA